MTRRVSYPENISRVYYSNIEGKCIYTAIVLQGMKVYMYSYYMYIVGVYNEDMKICGFFRATSINMILVQAKDLLPCLPSFVPIKQ